MKKRIAAVAPAAGCLLALSVALSGCSGDSSEPEAAQSSSPVAEASAATAVAEEASPSVASSASDSGPSSDPAESTEPTDQAADAIVASKSLDIKGAPDGVKVDLIQPVVNGKTMTVNFRLSVAANAEISFNTTNLNKGQSNGDAGLNAWLIADGQRYLPGRNQSGDCACTTGLRGMNIQEGESTTLSATFAAPKSEKFTVHLETVGDFENVSAQ
ncbi:MAG: hypothetical protein ACTIJJ_14580 [Galactobacter sp.]|uniref:hypothetical protein n=1 Tax=Galactobacter sp. TaxID=2676125 RepID=UPI0025BB38D5|nr:hypothetical protein [Galactobacter sp.]